MLFKEINEQEFKNISENIDCKNFFQTTMMMKRYELEKKEYYLVGVEKDKKIVAAALLVEGGKKVFGKKVFNAYKGPLLDYQDKSLLKFFLNELNNFVKEKNGYMLYIDPYIVSQTRNSDGDVIDGVDNLHVKKEIEELGYNYIGEYTQVKWNYCLDINGMSKEELFKTFKPNTRNNISKTLNKYVLDIRKLNIDELDEFKKITMDTCQRRGFADKSLEYYQNMYNVFDDEVSYFICELNIPKYLNKLEEENKIAEEKISNLSDSKSNSNKKIAFKHDIEANLKRIDEAKKLQSEKGDIIPLSCAMFILFGDEIVYLFSGSYDEYMKFNGQYRLQYEMIKFASEHNYKRYNFYGIRDLYEKNYEKDYGVYEFKKGFNGYVEELIGAYEIKVNYIYSVHHILKKLFKK